MKNKNIVTAFLDAHGDVKCNVFLVNGVKLEGFILDYDNEALYLKRDGIVQLVFKQAISTILPFSNGNFAADNRG